MDASDADSCALVDVETVNVPSQLDQNMCNDFNFKGLDDIEEEDEFAEGESVLTPDQDSDSEGEAEVERDSDDEWDTDLEDEGYLTKRKFISEDHARQVYLAACRQLKIVPAHCFLKGVNTESINLNFQGLGPIGTRAVATALVMDRASNQLYLAGNYIGKDGIRYICEMLKENDYLVHVDLSENDLSSYAAKLIADVFKENDTLVSLTLSGNQFKDTDAEHFAAILAIGPVFRNGQYTGLRKLDLSHNNLGDIGAKILGKAIGDNETLVELNLSWNQIRRTGIHYIAKGLGENNSLKILDLSANGVDDGAAGCVGKAMATNGYLVELNLNSNRIGIDGMRMLFTQLCKNECLKILRLTNNPISLEGPLVALALIRKSDVTVLDEIEIADACVPREFYAVLEEIQQTRPQFKVHLAGYMNTRDMCKAVAKTTQDNWMKDPTLVFINFIEERKYKIFDMFKTFDKDKSCSLTREEFITGLTKVGCPMDKNQLTQVLDVLDADKNGEVDLAEFMDGYAKHKRRFTKYKDGSRASSAVSRPPSSLAASRPSSRQVAADMQQVDGKLLLDIPNNPAALQQLQQTNGNTDVVLSVPKSNTALT